VKKKLIWIIPLAVIIVAVTSVVIYINIYYHADSTALAALVSDDKVTVTETDYGWFFDGPSDDSALIFYPGGKVEETSYAPLLHRLAGEGIDVCLVKMPVRLAFLGINKADSIIGMYDYDHWYIAGHSLGGVAASYYVSDNPGRIEGLILLASYSTKKIPESVKTVLIYGSEDKVLDLGKYNDNRSNIALCIGEVIIEGGNHAGFGNYGKQDGDGQASISAEEQQTRTVEMIMQYMVSSGK